MAQDIKKIGDIIGSKYQDAIDQVVSEILKDKHKPIDLSSSGCACYICGDNFGLSNDKGIFGHKVEISYMRPVGKVITEQKDTYAVHHCCYEGSIKH